MAKLEYNDKQIAMKNAFSIRLKKCRTDRGLSHEKLAKELQEKQNVSISKLTLINYEDCDKFSQKYESALGMNIAYLWAFAKYFDVSVDYLLGETDEQTIDDNIKIACETTGLSDVAIENTKRLPIQKLAALDLLLSFHPVRFEKILDCIARYIYFIVQRYDKFNGVDIKKSKDRAEYNELTQKADVELFRASTGLVELVTRMGKKERAGNGNNK